MKLSIQKEKLQECVVATEKIIVKSTALPILSNILIEALQGEISVIATNLEIGIEVRASANVHKQGKVVIPAKVFSDVVKVIPDDVIHIEVDGQHLTISSDNTNTTILCVDAAEYPIIPRLTGGEEFEVSQRSLAMAFARVSSAISSLDSRPEISGAYIAIGGKQLRVAGTDGFRLAEAKINLQEDLTLSCIVPRATVLELLHILKDKGDEAVKVRLSDNQISFSLDTRYVVSRVIDGSYPDYQKVIPQNSLSRVLVTRGDLERAVRAAAIFSSSISDVLITCTQDTVSLSAKNTQRGSSRSSVPVQVKGDPFEMSLNYTYLVDAMSATQTEKVILEFTGIGSPLLVKPFDESQNFVYVIMPLRQS